MDDIVEVEFEEDGEIEKYKLVTSIRGNSMENRVSIESPVGRALKGHKVGDRVQVKVNETMSYYLKIRSIEQNGRRGRRHQKLLRILHKFNIALGTTLQLFLKMKIY